MTWLPLIFAPLANYYLDGYVLVPAGVIIMSAVLQTPAGYLLCDGRELSKVEYADLYAVIGNKYTDISSTTTFKIPNMVGRVAVGKTDSPDPSYNEIGATCGEAAHILTVQEMPSHSRSVPTAGVDDANFSNQNGQIPASDSNNNIKSVSSGFTGGGLAHNNMQPYMVFRYLIKY